MDSNQYYSSQNNYNMPMQNNQQYYPSPMSPRRETPGMSFPTQSSPANYFPMQNNQQFYQSPMSPRSETPRMNPPPQTNPVLPPNQLPQTNTQIMNQTSFPYQQSQLLNQTLPANQSVPMNQVPQFTQAAPNKQAAIKMMQAMDQSSPNPSVQNQNMQYGSPVAQNKMYHSAIGQGQNFSQNYSQIQTNQPPICTTQTPIPVPQQDTSAVVYPPGNQYHLNSPEPYKSAAPQHSITPMSIEGQTANYTYSGNTPIQQGITPMSIDGQTPNYTYPGNTPIQQSITPMSIDGQTPNYTYTGNTPTQQHIPQNQATNQRVAPNQTFANSIPQNQPAFAGEPHNIPNTQPNTNQPSVSEDVAEKEPSKFRPMYVIGEYKCSDFPTLFTGPSRYVHAPHRKPFTVRDSRRSGSVKDWRANPNDKIDVHGRRYELRGGQYYAISSSRTNGLQDIGQKVKCKVFPPAERRRS